MTSRTLLPKVVAVVPTMRGVLAVANDGRTWHLADPYFGGPQQWVECPAIPLERNPALPQPSERP